jgi:hypothetical protein
MTITNKITQQQREAIEKAVLNIANASSEEELKLRINEGLQLRASLIEVIEEYLKDKLDSAFYFAECACNCGDDKMVKRMNIDEVRRDLYSFDIHIAIE